MIDPLDRRRNAIRDDLADIRLKGRVERPRYAEPQRRVVSLASVRCRRAPDGPAVDTEFLFGEPVDVFAIEDGEFWDPALDDWDIIDDHWAWVQSAVDGYVGYVEADALADPGPAPTHVVAVPWGIIYQEPSIKRGIVGPLPLGAAVHATGAVKENGETFLTIGALEQYRLALGKRGPLSGVGQTAYMLAKHLRPVGERARDFVSVAEMFVGAPYVWGGKTWAGLDCSGLVQLALQATGRKAPRDSDMQAEELGEPLPADSLLTRGDLVFWKGHVGIMVDDTRLLHANGHHMMTVVEPLAQARDRLDSMELSITVRRRLGPGVS